MALGAFWFSIMGLLVSLAGRRIPSMEIVFVRALITLVLSWAAVRRAGIDPPLGRNRRLLVLRGLLGAAALSCFMFSLTHLPLGEATLIQYTNPVFASLLAAMLFGERAGRLDVIALLVAMAGVVLVTRPAALFGAHAASIDTRNAIIALGGAVASGSAYAIIRHMGPERAEVIVLYLPLMALPISIPFAISGWVMPLATDWALLLGIGLTTQVAQTYMTRGLQLEKTARATPVGYLQIVFAMIWGALILHEPLTIWTAVGATIIVGSTLGIALLRHIAGAPDE